LLICLLIVVLYATIVYGSFAAAWGVDFSPTLKWWQLLVARGIESVLDTTFLSAFATPIAGLTGMVIAFLVVRKRFSGKDSLDFVSNLGGAVPGTILGIGFVLAFSTPPWFVTAILYGLLAFYLVSNLPRFHRSGRDDDLSRRGFRLGLLLIGTAIGVGLALLFRLLDESAAFYILGGIYLALGILVFGQSRRQTGGMGRKLTLPPASRLLLGMGLYLCMFNLAEFLAQPIADFSRTIPRGFWSNAIFQFSDYLKVFFQTPPPLTAIVYTFLSVLVIADSRWQMADRKDEITQHAARSTWLKIALTGGLLALIAALCFIGQPLALVGTPFIIIAAFVVRSLPASVRAGVAALQQIDPSIEEASGILGADSQYTFRKVTLPLILPALLAGLIFSFTRHMTSLSAIIFLVSARWRIVTASILSEWEQGGVSIAAGYSTVIIVVVLIAIGVLYFVTRRLLVGRGDVDLTLGA
jgi:iron(III) transport system permease protein